MEVTKQVSEKFLDFINDWYYETYLCLGGYGSGKSYSIGTKIVLKLLSEKRKCLVVREVYETITESCFDLFSEILGDLGLLAEEEEGRKGLKKGKVVRKKSPMSFEFPNGSKIIFKGMDKPAKVKSINGVSIVWLEECSEIKYDAFKELLGRIRTPDISMHFILSCNPVGKENWVYRHFFLNIDDNGNEKVILDENELYRKGCLVRNGVYYHHSLPDDNPFLPKGYVKRLDEMKSYDPYLWRVARLGRFGASGTRVLPQFEVATDARAFREAVKSIPYTHHFFGFDFGFEESFNAVVSMAVDDKEKVLYIYDEIYKNHLTDDKMAELPEMQKLKEKINSLWYTAGKMIVADNEDPKAIQYYRNNGFKIRSCRNKFAGSRLSNTRKIKRFRRIVCSPKCKNCIRELRDLTYKKDAKGNVIYDEFVIDPHTFSAIWYALDTYNVTDLKERKYNSLKG